MYLDLLFEMQGISYKYLTHTTTSLFYRFSGELFKLVYSLVCLEHKFLPIEKAAQELALHIALQW